MILRLSFGRSDPYLVGNRVLRSRRNWDAEERWAMNKSIKTGSDNRKELLSKLQLQRLR